MSASGMPTPADWRAGPALIRLVAAAVLLSSLVVLQGTALVEACLPAYRAVFGALAGEFRLVRMALDREGADRVLRAEIALRPVVVIHGKALTPDPRGRANASTLAVHGLLGPTLAILVAVGWPARRAREYALRIALAAPALAVLVLLDAPVVLAGELWQTVLERVAPGGFSPLVAWKDFLQAGGRLAIGVTVGLAAVALAARHPVPTLPAPQTTDR